MINSRGRDETTTKERDLVTFTFWPRERSLETWIFLLFFLFFLKREIMDWGGVRGRPTAKRFENK